MQVSMYSMYVTTPAPILIDMRVPNITVDI